ncbi:coagulation factor XII [Sceloporus undulatus]|uniref:coagulation factor XII n=1 Tax=Sceloporus undulatus TaxID=8520 RepID=UPI001C4D2129|nr:coagulation factor XII [Sceloporus undulatus]
MTSLLPLLLLLLFVVLSLEEPFLGIPHRPPKREHEEMPSNEEPCHFPFRYQRKMHYSCIPVSFINPRHWCATTENYDRDQKWRYCRKDERPVGEKTMEAKIITHRWDKDGITLPSLSRLYHNQMCYSGNGHLYRGTAQNSASGASCVPWDSPFLHFEFSSQSSNADSLGLGAHPFCRNPDNDSQPWCYVLHNMQLTWEFCNVTQCLPERVGDMVQLQEREPTESEQKSPNETVGSGTMLSESINFTPVCGQRYTKTASSNKRIVGGMVALPGSHPYMAALYIGDQFCGGSLIASCWILTAAHCLEFRPDVSKISVVLGQTLYNTSTEGSMKLHVQAYQLHENYSVLTKQHDIALVQLKEKMSGRCAEFSHSISPICLPSSMKSVFDTNKQCQIAGWGHMYEGADKLSLYLQEADIPIIPQEQCYSREIHGNRITQGMLCAGYLDGRADACQGDSGGPLVCEEQNKATVHGIVSWGTGCAQENKPGVYTNVAHYIDWIQSNMH